MPMQMRIEQISHTECQSQSARLLAVTREDLRIDLHRLPGIGRQVGEEDAACFARFVERIEFDGDIGDESCDHYMIL